MNLSRYGFKRFHNSLLCPQSYFINIRVRILLLKLVFLIFHWKQNFPKIRDRLLELDIHKYLKHNMFKYKPNLSPRKPVLPYGLLIYIMLLPSTQYLPGKNIGSYASFLLLPPPSNYKSQKSRSLSIFPTYRASVCPVNLTSKIYPV